MINRIQKFIKENKEALIFIFIGLLCLSASLTHFIEGEIDFTRERHGHGDRKGFLVELLLYKLGGTPLVIAFYLIIGICLIMAGSGMLKRKT